MAFEHILFSIEDGVALLSLNRPDQLNSFNTQMHKEVREALKQVRANAQVRVSDCRGNELANATTDAQGVVRVATGELLVGRSGSDGVSVMTGALLLTCGGSVTSVVCAWLRSSVP